MQRRGRRYRRREGVGGSVANKENDGSERSCRNASAQPVGGDEQEQRRAHGGRRDQRVIGNRIGLRERQRASNDGAQGVDEQKGRCPPATGHQSWTRRDDEGWDADKQRGTQEDGDGDVVVEEE